VGAAQGGLFVGGVLQLQDYQGQAVDEQDDVGPAAAAVLEHGELVHCQPVVVGRIIEVNHADLCAAQVAVGIAVFHRHAIHQQAVQGAVALKQVAALGLRQLAPGILQRLGGQVGVEPAQRLAQVTFQDHLIKALPFGKQPVRRKLRAMSNPPADGCQPPEGGRFNSGFLHGGHRALRIIGQSARFWAGIRPR